MITKYDSIELLSSLTLIIRTINQGSTHECKTTHGINTLTYLFYFYYYINITFFLIRFPLETELVHDYAYDCCERAHTFFMTIKVTESVCPPALACVRLICIDTYA